MKNSPAGNDSRTTPENGNAEIDSLIRLMDDRDAFVRERVQVRLVELGEEALPFLEKARSVENLALRAEIAEVLKRIEPRLIGQEFEALAQTPASEDLDLEQGVCLIMRYGHPDADPVQVEEMLDSLAANLAPRIRAQAGGEELVRALTDFLFHEKGFHGNKTDYFNPNNSYFDTVLSEKAGIPITLSVLCILVGQRLDLPISGVGLPGHFVARCDTGKAPVFFDPFNDGRVITPAGCEEMVKGFGIQFEESFLLPVTNREILIRMLHNLIMIYNRTNDTDKAEQLTEYSRILMQRK
ncbi:transglutaminase-like domain-containing protein [Nitrospina gracilis]|uniref:transglutaminase-like domain-containing protein n=1 Tax=Nitrospina gracilis TaxID=35801 RepID=UPI001F2899BF|nr:transglutaminase-like domain-containing protein [Nitrospina gracilis]MCF8721399.1 regulator of sirC expression with transglutaminase-like and TPR domain [Nitrospina gracilis Nb-211]